MKMKIKAWLIWHKYDWAEETTWTLNDSNMSGCGPDWVGVNQQEFEVDVPDNFDPRPMQIKALRDEKEKLLAETHVKANNLDDQIQKLLSIEDKSYLKVVA